MGKIARTVLGKTDPHIYSPRRPRPVPHPVRVVDRAGGGERNRVGGEDPLRRQVSTHGRPTFDFSPREAQKNKAELPVAPRSLPSPAYTRENTIPLK